MARSFRSTTIALVAAGWVLCIQLVAPSTAFAYSGFTPAPQSLYAKLAYSTTRSNQFWDLVGNLNDRGQPLTQRSLNLYAEYGIIRHLGLIASFPAVRAINYANTGTATGVGDLYLALKGGVSFHNLHLALSVGPELPTGRDAAEVQTDTGLGLLLPTGDGELNVWSRFGISYGFGLPSLEWLSAWASAGAGYNVRTKGFSDQIGYGADIGVVLWNLVILQARMNGQTVPSDDVRYAGFIFGEGTEFLALGAGVAVSIPHTPLALTFDWDRPFFGLKNLYSGSVFGVGISASLSFVDRGH